MTYTYVLASVKTEALPWVRWRLGDNKGDDRNTIEDEEISAALNCHGLTDTSAPADNRSAIHKAAADAARAIAAGFGKDSEIAITEVGRIKNDAASFYLRLATQLEKEAAIVKPEDLEPAEEMDSLDYDVGPFGRDRSEYVGDVV